jgi:hypothetical protein
MKTQKSLSPAQRREYVRNLREAGLSFEKIAQQARAEFGPENLPQGYGKRMVHQYLQRALNPGAPVRLYARERQSLIWEFRVNGLPYSEILTRLIEKMGPDRLPANYNVHQISRDFNRELRRRDQPRQQQPEAMQALNQSRLEQLLQTFMPLARAGDLKAAALVLKIISLSRQSHLRSLPIESTKSIGSFINVTEQFSNQEV